MEKVIVEAAANGLQPRKKGQKALDFDIWHALVVVKGPHKGRYVHRSWFFGRISYVSWNKATNFKDLEHAEAFANSRRELKLIPLSTPVTDRDKIVASE